MDLPFGTDDDPTACITPHASIIEMPVANPRFVKYLDDAGLRPVTKSKREPKQKYAQTLSRMMSLFAADLIRPHFSIVTPFDKERGHEKRLAAPDGEYAQVDVTACDRKRQLLLLMSIKCPSFTDLRTGKLTKNIVNRRRDLIGEGVELRDLEWVTEETCLTALFCLPFEATLDGKKGASSFAHAAMRLRRSVRPAAFDRIFVGVYEHVGTKRGSICFVDVMSDVPGKGLPRKTLSVEDFTQALIAPKALRQEAAE